MADITEAIRRLTFQYVSEGADKVMQTQEAIAASTVQTDKASLSLEKSFGNLERRYVETVRHQQDYQKVQAQVNAAVAQNPALQDRANVVLAAAAEHYDKLAVNANKGGIATSFLSKALTTILGPAGLIGIALTALTAAIAYLVEKFQLIPQALDWIRAGLASVGFEQAAQKVGEYAQRMRDVNDAAEAQKAALLAIQAVHGNRISTDVAKELQLMQAQLAVAQARTQEEKISAQYQLDKLQALQQDKTLTEATALAAGKRAIAEENAAAALEKSVASAQQLNVEYDLLGRLIDQAALGYDLLGREINSQTTATDDVADSTKQVGNEIKQNTTYVSGMTNAVTRLNRETYKTAVEWAALGERMRGIPTQFGGEVFTSDWGPAAELKGLWERFRPENFGVDPSKIKPTSELAVSKLSESLETLTDSTGTLTDSTDSLNATMQNALSPFYSQDPRTTKLGFRAGVTGNPDWMTGATNANPLVAVLGAGATAPGMAGGGSFVVGGGYSANDNRMAVFPVASGEEVVVNRTKQPGAQSINIDNRIIINGSVDDDALSKMKVSRYQQAQRMRAGLRA